MGRRADSQWRTQNGVVLHASSTRSVDFVVAVGEVTETAEVVATAQQVDPNSGGIGNVINAQQLGQIAMNGRGFTQLLRLTPGATSNTLDVFPS